MPCTLDWPPLPPEPLTVNSTLACLPLVDPTHVRVSLPVGMLRGRVTSARKSPPGPVVTLPMLLWLPSGAGNCRSTISLGPKPEPLTDRSAPGATLVLLILIEALVGALVPVG